MSLGPILAVAGEQAASSTDWGTVIVAVVGFAGIIVTQILTSRRDKAQLQHQVSAALRQRRLEAYAALIEATNNLMLLIPEVLTEESGAGALKGSERGPMNAASSTAHLLASPPVQDKISELVDAVYEYADGLSGEAWEAFDHAMALLWTQPKRRPTTATFSGAPRRDGRSARTKAVGKRWNP